jgi:hypothetical protein
MSNNERASQVSAYHPRYGAMVWIARLIITWWLLPNRRDCRDLSRGPVTHRYRLEEYCDLFTVRTSTYVTRLSILPNY